MGRSRESLPFKGTKIRQVALLLMRPEGLTAREAMEYGLITDVSNFTRILNNLEENYNIVIKPAGKVRRTKAGKPSTRYKNNTVGRRELIYRITSIYTDSGKFREI